jgi:hypothetical protein
VEVLVYGCEVDERGVTLKGRLPWAGATAA